MKHLLPVLLLILLFPGAASASNLPGVVPHVACWEPTEGKVTINPNRWTWSGVASPALIEVLRGELPAASFSRRKSPAQGGIHLERLPQGAMQPEEYALVID